MSLASAQRQSPPVRLSPQGRQKFGEWLANRLTVLAGGILGLVVVPGLLGPDRIPAGWIVAALLGGGVVAATAVLIYYVTAHRVGEPKEERTDG